MRGDGEAVPTRLDRLKGSIGVVVKGSASLVALQRRSMTRSQVETSARMYLMDYEARRVDRRSLLFTPTGLGGPITPVQAITFAEHEIQRLALPELVPTSVRAQFSVLLFH